MVSNSIKHLSLPVLLNDQHDLAPVVYEEITSYTVGSVWSYQVKCVYNHMWKGFEWLHKKNVEAKKVVSSINNEKKTVYFSCLFYPWAEHVTFYFILPPPQLQANSRSFLSHTHHSLLCPNLSSLAMNKALNFSEINAVRFCSFILCRSRWDGQVWSGDTMLFLFLWLLPLSVQWIRLV